MMSSTAETIIYLIPTFLAAEARETIPDYVREALENCEVIFAENERTTRRFMKSISPKINIDSFEWHTMLEVAQLVAAHYPGTTVQPSTTGDLVQRDARNDPDSYILQFWRPEITLAQGIADIVQKMQHDADK